MSPMDQTSLRRLRKAGTSPEQREGIYRSVEKKPVALVEEIIEERIEPHGQGIGQDVLG